MLHTGEKMRNLYKMDVGFPKEKRHLDSLRVGLRWTMILTASTETGQAGRQAGRQYQDRTGTMAATMDQHDERSRVPILFPKTRAKVKNKNTYKTRIHGTRNWTRNDQGIPPQL